MSLPELSWQIVYGRLAWGIVLATIACAIWPRAWQLSRGKAGALLGGGALLLALPGAASPVYWLGLAFQWPSALLLGLCMVRLHAAWRGQGADATMNPALAMLIALAGLVLYLDAFGLTAFGLYYWGFSAHAAPGLALLLAGGAAAAALYRQALPQAMALLLAVVLFALLRLPSGNLWDALLDPLLWIWTLIFLACRSWQRIGRVAVTNTTME